MILNEPIVILIFKLSAPVFFAFLAIVSLAIVDSYFIGFLGAESLAAIGFIRPVNSLLTCLGLGLGMSLSSLNSRLVGKNDTQHVVSLISDGFFLTFFLSILMTVILFAQIDDIFKFIGADEKTLPLIIEYMNVWILSTPFIILTMVFTSVFQSLGDTKTSAQISIFMTLTNLILDPLLIFGVGPFPKFGIMGAALASLIAAILAFLIGFYKLIHIEKLLKITSFSFSSFKKNAMQLISIAVPATLSNSIMPLSAVAITMLAALIGTEVVAGYGVGARIEALSLSVAYAISAVLPNVVGQNLGAQKPERAKEAIKKCFQFVFALKILICFLLIISSELIAKLFTSDEGIIEIIVLYLYIVPITYGLGGLILLINALMIVLGQPKLALYINFIRMFILYIPFGYLGSKYYGTKGLFLGVAIGIAISYLMAAILFRKVSHNSIPGYRVDD